MQFKLPVTNFLWRNISLKLKNQNISWKMIGQTSNFHQLLIQLVTPMYKRIDASKIKEYLAGLQSSYFNLKEL